MIIGFNIERERCIQRMEDKRKEERCVDALINKLKPKYPTKRVYICSPLKGDIERNMRKAELYCRFAFEKGFVPVAPHIYYPRFLDDRNKKERAAGLRYGLEEIWRCKELWVFGGHRSEGMKAEIKLATELEIPVRYFNDNLEEIDG